MCVVSWDVICTKLAHIFFLLALPGKMAVTVFERQAVLNEATGVESIVLCTPETGRTNQIRLHLQWLGEITNFFLISQSHITAVSEAIPLLMMHNMEGNFQYQRMHHRSSHLPPLIKYYALFFLSISSTPSSHAQFSSTRASWLSSSLLVLRVPTGAQRHITCHQGGIVDENHFAAQPFLPQHTLFMGMASIHISSSVMG